MFSWFKDKLLKQGKSTEDKGACKKNSGVLPDRKVENAGNWADNFNRARYMDRDGE